MSKLLGKYAEKNRQFSDVIAGRLRIQRKKGIEVSIKAGYSPATYYNRLKNPEDMTVKELRVYIHEGEIPECDVINFLYP